MPDYWTTRHPDEEIVKAASEAAPNDLWLLASIDLNRIVSTRGPYPHVCRRGGGTRWGKGCAACVAARRAEEGRERAAERRQAGNDGHACRPAERGAGQETWQCPDCGADWEIEIASRAGVVTRTWYRA